MEAEPLEEQVEKEELEVKEVKEGHLVLGAIVRPRTECGQLTRIGMTPITVSGIVGVTNTQLMTPAPTLLLLLKLENALIGGVDTWDIREQKERMVLKAQLATLGWMRKQQRWGRRVVLVKMRRNLVPKSFIYTNQ